MQNFIHTKVNPRIPTTFTPYELGEFVRSIVAHCASLVENQHGEIYALELRALLASDESSVCGFSNKTLTS